MSIFFFLVKSEKFKLKKDRIENLTRLKDSGSKTLSRTRQKVQTLGAPY